MTGVMIKCLAFPFAVASDDKRLAFGSEALEQRRGSSEGSLVSLA